MKCEYPNHKVEMEFVNVGVTTTGNPAQDSPVEILSRLRVVLQVLDSDRDAAIFRAEQAEARLEEAVKELRALASKEAACVLSSYQACRSPVFKTSCPLHNIATAALERLEVKDDSR
jgi:hypothetical protein